MMNDNVEFNSSTLEFRIKNPMCAFCANSYIKFMTTRCSITDDHKNLCAKTCNHYKPISAKEKNSQTYR